MFLTIKRHDMKGTHTIIRKRKKEPFFLCTYITTFDIRTHTHTWYSGGMQLLSRTRRWRSWWLLLLLLLLLQPVDGQDAVPVEWYDKRRECVLEENVFTEKMDRREWKKCVLEENVFTEKIYALYTIYALYRRYMHYIRLYWEDIYAVLYMLCIHTIWIY